MTLRYKDSDGRPIIARRIGNVLVEIPVYGARLNTKPGERVTQTSQMFQVDQEALAENLLARVANAMAGEKTTSVQRVLPGGIFYGNASIDEIVRMICPASARVVRELDDHHAHAMSERPNTIGGALAGMPIARGILAELGDA